MRDVPGTPLEVMKHLGGLSAELGTVTKKLHQAELDMVEKRHAADLAEAHAYLVAEGPVEERKRQALKRTEQAEHEAEVAEALVRILKRDIATLETRIGVGRSYSAIIRAEMSLLNYSPDP